MQLTWRRRKIAGGKCTYGLNEARDDSVVNVLKTIGWVARRVAHAMFQAFVVMSANAADYSSSDISNVFEELRLNGRVKL